MGQNNLKKPGIYYERCVSVNEKLPTVFFLSFLVFVIIHYFARLTHYYSWLYFTNSTLPVFSL